MVLQVPLERPVRASSNRKTGRSPIATEIVKDPKWLQSDVAETAASWCKIGFRTDWDSRQSPGPGLVLFFAILPRHKADETIWVERVME